MKHLAKFILIFILCFVGFSAIQYFVKPDGVWDEQRVQVRIFLAAVVAGFKAMPKF